jgi:hypothetical protein
MSSNEVNWFGFYTDRPFFVEKSIERLPHLSRLHAVYSKIVWENETEIAKLQVAQDGLIMIAFKKTLTSRAVVEYLNCLYVLLESRASEFLLTRAFDIAEIKLSDVLVLKYQAKNLIQVDLDGINSHTRHHYNVRNLQDYMKVDLRQIDMSQGGFWDNIIHANILYNERNVLRKSRVLPLTIFDLLLQDFKRIGFDFTIVQVVSSLTKSLQHYREGNYADSLIASWFIIEAYLFELWKTKVNQGIQNSDEDQSTSSAIIIRDLKQARIIPYEVANELHQVRLARNEVVHNKFNSTPKQEDAYLAILAIKSFVARDTGVTLTINL